MVIHHIFYLTRSDENEVCANYFWFPKLKPTTTDGIVRSCVRITIVIIPLFKFVVSFTELLIWSSMNVSSFQLLSYRHRPFDSWRSIRQLPFVSLWTGWMNSKWKPTLKEPPLYIRKDSQVIRSNPSNHFSIISNSYVKLKYARC